MEDKGTLIDKRDQISRVNPLTCVCCSGSYARLNTFDLFCRMFQRHSHPNGWAPEEEVYGESEKMQEL